ncbi:hypothetical protein [Bremerella cremea]|uniref:hypothetical protein n=1 Tax=Bremerella cremea TaxID=1031537 RepID=UPI0031E6E886
MPRFALALVLTFSLLMASGDLHAQTTNNSPGSSVSLGQALTGVRWQGRMPSEAVIGDKTPIVMVYASWCPKCNVWSPDAFNQIRESIKDKPIVLFAINADESTRGVNYALERNLVGPNIFHGDDPSIVRRMGLDSELFKYSVFQDGMQSDSGSIGAYFPGPNDSKDFAIARKLKTGMNGEFSVLSPDMSEGLKQLLWPAEVGSKLDERSLLSMRKNMDDDLTSEFNSAVSGFLNRQVEKIKASREGSMPERLAGYELAEQVATDFKSTPQGRACRELVDQLKEDESFQDELTAKKLYEQGMQKANSAVTLRRAMGRVISRYPETHFGKEAQKAVDSAS